jgi:3-deoxy-D-manno-octulosonic acid (KDO) 8-phosphate synthase
MTSKNLLSEPMTLIADPCVIEDDGLLTEVSTELKRQLAGLPIELYFKASFDKANRSSIEGFRGPGLKDGLAALEKAKVISRTAFKEVPPRVEYALTDHGRELGAILRTLETWSDSAR